MKECKYCHILIDEKSINFPNHVKYCNHNPNRIKSVQNSIDAVRRSTDNKYGKLTEYVVNCSVCGDAFNIIEREYRFDSNKAYHCSRSCANKRIHTNETKRKISHSVKCRIIESGGTLREHQQELNKTRGVYKKRMYNNTCAVCGIDVGNKRKKFCCDAHKILYSKERVIKNRNELYNKIEIMGYHNNTSVLKKYLIHKTGNLCSICGFTGDWNGMSITMILDHINGHSSDNRLENVRLVCPMCDTQLPTFKSKNKKSDRVKRKGVW